MKRIIPIFAALLLILSLSGCGYSAKDLSNAKDTAYSAGYSEAETAHKLDYENGYAAAEEEHKADYDNGYRDGYSVGYEQAISDQESVASQYYDTGYNIGYSAGVSASKGDSAVDSAAPSEPSVYAPENTSTAAISSSASLETSYIANTSTYKFHKPSCSSVKQMKESNKWYYTGSRDDLISKGYDPCGRCHP
nr:MAG TPA: Metal binding domain of Ada [Caudoviricetes sp.]